MRAFQMPGKSEGHPRVFSEHLSGFSSAVAASGMLRIVNVEQKILALEALLEKVRTNAAQPRPARGAVIATTQPTTAASRATDDIAGPAVAAPVRITPAVTPGPGMTKFGDDDWSDTTETFGAPIPLAAPLPGLAKEAPKTPAATASTAAKPGPAKPVITAPKAAEPPQAKPLTAPVSPAAKPAPVTPIAKPAPVTPAAKPVAPAAIVKPTAPANTPIPLTNKVAPPVIKTPATPAPAPVTAVKPPIGEANLYKTLTGVGDGAVKAPDIRAGALAAGISLPITGEPPPVEPILELEKKPLPTNVDVPAKPSLPSAIADADGEEENEPTQLYEASAASRRAAELAALTDKQLEDAKKSLGIDKKSESDKVEIRLPDAKDSPEKIDVKDGPRLDLPWVEKTEKKAEPDAAGLSAPDDGFTKKGPSQTELDLELVAAQEGSLQAVDLDVTEQKEPKDTKPATPAVSEEKPTVTPEPAAVVEKKPPVVAQPVVTKKPVVAEPELSEPTKPTKGVPVGLIIAAVILLLAAGAFVAMQQGWIGGSPPAPAPAPTQTSTVAPPTNPTATQTAAPTATATETAAPPASASAAPGDSAAPATSAAPADSAAAAPADSAAAPAPSASAAAATPPPVAGSPSIDPATLNNNQGLIFVTSNKPARVYLTGKLVGDTNTELKSDCGLKFVRLADPAQDLAKPPMWLTPGEPKQIDCRKYTTFTVNVP